ncbi:MAG: inositol monophosphatase family protein [Candidatus Bathyarchaeia archaeon]
MEKKSLHILREMAKEVYLTVHPLLGTLKSGEIVGSGFGGDKTKLIDAVAEEAIINYLTKNDLSCIFIGEERGVEKIGDAPRFYLITDGVDGTTNAVRGINFASTAMAISPTDRLGDLEAAVVMDLSNGGVYAAEKGKGAFYNGEKIKPSKTVDLEDAILSIDISRAPEAVEKMIHLMKVLKSLRSLGSASLEICLVASGLLDAYVDVRGKLRTLDIAAAMLILKEAGGLFLQPNGEEPRDVTLTKLNRFSIIAAANKKIFNEITALIPKA